MLDIVMAAHKPNFLRMAHRALNPIGGNPDTSVRGSLQSAVDRMSINGKVILSLEGGLHPDFEAAESYLHTQNLPWQILHNEEITNYHGALMLGLEHCSSPMVAIIPPWTEIVDSIWVQRMLWPMQTDPTALLCTTWEEQGPAKDLAPHVAMPRKWPGGEIIVGHRQVLIDQLRVSGSDYDKLAVGVAAAGWRVWAHPGIRFNLLEHDNHHEARPETRRTAGSATAGSDR